MVRVRALIQAVFSEVALGFFALLALTAALIPLFFQVGGGVLVWLSAVQWAVVGLFFIEYGIGLSQAKNKTAYLGEPLRVFMAIMLVVALASLLDSVPDGFVIAPSLRVIHVVLAALFGLQAGAVTVERERNELNRDKVLPKEVFVLHPEEGIREASWIELMSWCESRTTCWYHAENVAAGDLPEIAAKWNVPLAMLQICVGEENYPRVEFFHGTILLSVWLRIESPSGELVAAPVVLLVHGDSVLSITRMDTDLLQRIDTQETELPGSEMSFSSHMVLAVLELAARSAEKRVDSCERRLREMERTPVGKARRTLFAQAYGIKQELASLYADLWRLRGMINRLDEGKIKLVGASGALGALGRHIEFLYTTVDNLREGVISIIELHMNSASFEMTRFMRLLAVVNVLALIPAVVGGLLGMNILGAPWPLDMSQVAFGTVLANVFCLYYFAVKGWLR